MRFGLGFALAEVDLPASGTRGPARGRSMKNPALKLWAAGPVAAAGSVLISAAGAGRSSL